MVSGLGDIAIGWLFILTHTLGNCSLNSTVLESDVESKLPSGKCEFNVCDGAIVGLFRSGQGNESPSHVRLV